MNKKHVLVSLALLASSFYGVADAATGIVDINTVLKGDQQFIDATKVMGTEEHKAMESFNKESKGMTQKEAEALAVKYKKQLDSKSDQLMAPIQKKIFDAVEKIAKEKNLDTVVVPGSLVYGQPSVDITQDVQKELKK